MYMKRAGKFALLSVLSGSLVLSACGDDQSVETLEVAEVTRSIFLCTALRCGGRRIFLKRKG